LKFSGFSQTKLCKGILAEAIFWLFIIRLVKTNGNEVLFAGKQHLPV
jgi:hypothetical protein